MRKALFDTTAKFQVSDDMLTAAKEKAAREGMTFSEFVRSALRRELKPVEHFNHLSTADARGEADVR